MRRLILLLIAPLGGLACLTAYVRLNVSPSLPYGLYRVHAVAERLTVGTLVLLDRPAWRPHPLLKPIAALAGERVCHRDGHLIIRDEDYGAIYASWRGHPLPAVIAPETCLTVPPGQVFVATAAPQSLDSRYYGAVALDEISATATPWLTWGPVHAATPVR